MPETFYTASFNTIGPAVEWDGTNHEELLDWFNEVASPPLTTVSVSPTEWVLTNGTRTTTMTAPPKWWARSSVGPMLVSGTGRWRTSDPGGRPTSMDDLLYEP